MFEEAIRERCRLFDFEIASHDLHWPDEPMEHGYAVAGMDGLKEYMGIGRRDRGARPAMPRSW